MDPTANKTTVRRLFEDGVNPGRPDVIAELVGDEHVGPRGEHGAAGFQRTFAELRAAFPDVHYTVDELVAEGDLVAMRWRWTGTHRGAFRTHAATERAVTNSGTGIFEVRGGKIVRSTIETDRLGFLLQIGAIPADLVPAPGPAPVPAR